MHQASIDAFAAAAQRMSEILSVKKIFLTIGAAARTD